MCGRITIVAVKNNYCIIIVSACGLNFPACNVHTYILSSVSYFGCRISVHNILQLAPISGDVIEYKMTVTISPQILSQTFLFLITIQRVFITNTHTSSCKLAVIIVEI